MRIVAAVLFFALAQMVCAGVVYEFNGNRSDGSTTSIYTFTLTLPDYIPFEPNVYHQYTPGVDNLTCNGCTSVWLGTFWGSSWQEDEVWWGDANVTHIFDFPLNIFGTDGVHQAAFGEGTLTIYQGAATPSGVPEPSSLALVFSGGATAFLWGCRRRARR